MSTADWTPGYTNRWQNDKIKALSPLAKGTFDYLTSSSKTTASGIYPLDLDIASKELGLKPILLSLILEEIATVHGQLPGDRSPLVKFDGSVVWVVGQWKHACNQGPNHKSRVGLEFNRAPRLPYWLEFFDRYPEIVTHCTNPKSRFTGSELFGRLLEALKKTPELTGSGAYRSASPRQGPELYEALHKCFPEALRKHFGSTSFETLPRSPSEGHSHKVENISTKGVGSSQPNPLPKSEKKSAPEAEVDPLDLAPGEAPGELVHGPIGRHEIVPTDDLDRPPEFCKLMNKDYHNPNTCEDCRQLRPPIPTPRRHPLDGKLGDKTKEAIVSSETLPPQTDTEPLPWTSTESTHHETISEGPPPAVGDYEVSDPQGDKINLDLDKLRNSILDARTGELHPNPKINEPETLTPEGQEIKKPAPKYAVHQKFLARLDAATTETPLNDLRALITGLVKARCDGMINAEEHRAFSDHVTALMNEIEGGQP